MMVGRLSLKGLSRSIETLGKTLTSCQIELLSCKLITIKMQHKLVQTDHHHPDEYRLLL